MENHFAAAYKEAFELARIQLLARDVSEVCFCSGARLAPHSPSTTIELLYLNSPVAIELPSCAVSAQDQPVVHIWDKILLLHYLANSCLPSAAPRQISFKELKSAALYYQLFENRCLIPLIKAFCAQPELLLDNALAQGAQVLQAGDAAVQLQVLPNISVTAILWKADEEFPASASILFDATIEQYLPPEDIVVLCQRMVLKLLKKW
jgi:hypothetical protein